MKENDILVGDEWYKYYRDCSNRLKKILDVLDNPKFINQDWDSVVWDSIIEIREFADIKDPEEMREWLLRCKDIVKN